MQTSKRKKSTEYRNDSVKLLSIEQADTLLSNLGLKVGAWNAITSATQASETSGGQYKMFRAPSTAHSLHAFAEHVAGWLSEGEWKIIQVDNSTSLSVVTAAPIASLLFTDSQLHSPNDINQACIKFSFGADRKENAATELLISNLIFFFLLFQCHVEIVSSTCLEGQFLSIQDGYVYFTYGHAKLERRTVELLRKFEAAPEQSPDWVIKILNEFEDD